MKLLYLNSVITIPNSEGEKKIVKALENKEKTDDNGKNLEWYKDMGLRPPKDMEEEDVPEISEDGFMKLKPSEFEYDFVDCVLRLDDFSSCIDNQEIGSIIYTRHADEIWVEESSEEIYGYITILTRPWYIVAVDNLKYYFQFLLRKIKGEKKVDLA